MSCRAERFVTGGFNVMGLQSANVPDTGVVEFRMGRPGQKHLSAARHAEWIDRRRTSSRKAELAVLDQISQCQRSDDR